MDPKLWVNCSIVNNNLENKTGKNPDSQRKQNTKMPRKKLNKHCMRLI